MSGFAEAARGWCCLAARAGGARGSRGGASLRPIASRPVVGVDRSSVMFRQAARRNRAATSASRVELHVLERLRGEPEGVARSACCSRLARLSARATRGRQVDLRPYALVTKDGPRGAVRRPDARAARARLARGEHDAAEHGVAHGPVRRPVEVDGGGARPAPLTGASLWFRVTIWPLHPSRFASTDLARLRLPVVVACLPVRSDRVLTKRYVLRIGL